jgi:pantoate--beta-alanine ligase
MVEDLHVPVEVRTYPTVREQDGLALSSRNRYLDPAQRHAATALFRALEAAKHLVAQGQRNADPVRQILRETIELERSVKVDYAEVADAETLEPLGDLGKGRRAVALVAAWLGTTRLIDNMMLLE